MARLEREAKTISWLQHPNVRSLRRGFRDSRTDYLVMKYLDGETLEDRIGRVSII